MKRALFFLALFATGLALLLRLEEVHRAPGRGAGAQRVLGGFRPRAERPDGGSRAALTVDGSFVAIRYARRGADGDARRSLFEIHAQDSASLAGGETVFETVTAVLNNSETGAVRAVVRAARGRLAVNEAGFSYPIDLEQEIAEDTLHLEDVLVTLYEDAPVVPLELSVAHLEGNLTDRVFTSADETVASGPGLVARGQGVLLDLTRGVVRFSSDALVTLEEEEGVSASLSSAGKMHLLRGSAEAGVEAVARGGAELEVTRPRPLHVWGETINVISVEAPAQPEGRGAEQGLRVSALAADGDARVETSTGVFAADRADFRRSGDGQRMLCELTGEPTVDVELRQPRDGPATEPAPAATRIRARGAGPLLAEIGPADTFEFGGPARASWEQNEVVSRGGLRGWSEEGGPLIVSGWDGVTLSQPTATLETAALELTLTGEGDESSLVQAVSDGPSTLTGVTSAGEPFALEAEHQVVYRGQGGRWHVPLAIGVDLDVAAEVALRVRAERVEDLYLAERRMSAEGDVAIERGDERAWGQRLRTYAPDHFVLYGTREAPAHLARPDAYLEALELERDGQRLAAAGSVAAQFTRDEWSGEIRSESLEAVARRPSPDQRGAPYTESYELWCGGGVDVHVEEPARSIDVGCASLHGVLGRTLDPAGRELRATSRLELNGGVEALSRGPQGEIELEARAAAVDHDRARGQAARWLATASGDVRFESSGEVTLRGRGDALRADQSEVLRLEGLDGQRIHVEGVLPGRPYPFVLDAPSAQLSTERVEAVDVHLVVRSLSVLPGPELRPAPTAELVAEADRLTAVEDELLFSGAVSLRGVDDNDDPLQLESSFVQFEGGAPADAGGPTFRRMNAWGGFDFRYGDNLYVTGDRIEARATTGRLKVTGTPARIHYGFFVRESESLEYDLFLRMIVRAAGGTTRSRLGELPSPAPAPGATPDDAGNEDRR